MIMSRMKTSKHVKSKYFFHVLVLSDNLKGASKVLVTFAGQRSGREQLIVRKSIVTTLFVSFHLSIVK